MEFVNIDGGLEGLSPTLGWTRREILGSLGRQARIWSAKLFGVQTATQRRNAKLEEKEQEK